MVKNIFALFGLALMALMSVGCCANKPLNVTVELDDAMRQRLQSREIEVHIVALNSKQNERWENYSMTKYWEPGDTVRESVPTFKMYFKPDKAEPQTLTAKDPMWATWLANASKDDKMQLYVLALLPGTYEDAQGDKDVRRQILPLSSCRWKAGFGGSPDVRLKVSKTGVITMTPPKPED